MAEFSTADGQRLHRVDWPCASPGRRGTVLIVHGLGEHSGRYAHVGKRLSVAGWDVVGYDQRGHGRSPGARGALPQGDTLLVDLGAVVAQRRQEQPGRPLLLLGHSMGGAVTARYVAEGLSAQPAAWWQAVDGLMLSSPLLAVDMTAVQSLMLAVFGTLAPSLAVGNGLKPAWICRDPAVVKAYLADPLVHDRVTPRLARFFIDASTLVRQRAAQWSLPTLLLYAGADRCVAPRGSAEFATAAPAAILRNRRFDGLFHEIFNEPEQAQVLDDLLAWLDHRYPTLNEGKPP